MFENMETFWITFIISILNSFKIHIWKSKTEQDFPTITLALGKLQFCDDSPSALTIDSYGWMVPHCPPTGDSGANGHRWRGGSWLTRSKETWHVVNMFQVTRGAFHSRGVLCGPWWIARADDVADLVTIKWHPGSCHDDVAYYEWCWRGS